MTTINTIEDLARLLREQPTWAEAMRALILSEDLLDLPARFERFMEAQAEYNARLTQFVEEQRQFNADQQQFNVDQRQLNSELRQVNAEQRQISADISRRLGHVEGRLGNLEGGQFERNARAKALARSIVSFGFESAYVALTQDGVTDPRLTSSVDRAIGNGSVTRDGLVNLYQADLVISAARNRHMVVEISITADNSDIQRARARAKILADITGGEVTPAVLTAILPEPQKEQAEAENVTVFVIPDS